MRTLLLVNTSASSVTPRVRVIVQRALTQAGHEVAVAESNRRGHATRIAQGAARDGVDVVVALGGDGTVNEVANGLLGSDTALGVLPGGSTNVFARTLGLVNDPVEATGQLLAALGRGSLQRIGVGTVEGRAFLFHVGMGFDAAVVEEVERRGTLKRWLGHALFLTAAFRTFARFDRRNPAFDLHLPGGVTVPSGFAIALNTDPYTYFGERPFALIPEATLDRPLGLVAFRHLSLWSLVRTGIGSLLAGPSALAGNPHVAVAHDVPSIRAVGRRPFPYQVDGDHLGDATELALGWEPDALLLVVPGRPHAGHPSVRRGEGAG